MSKNIPAFIPARKGAITTKGQGTSNIFITFAEGDGGNACVITGNSFGLNSSTWQQK